MDTRYTQAIDRRAQALCALSDEIWGYAETAFTEYKSMDALCRLLAEEGFAVEKGVGGVPTAFTARWGEGKPVLGFLGEYDALFGLAQDAGAARPQVTTPAPAGHGCGHNLLGVGSLAAALALKDYLTQTGTPGTVVYFGCPGEEGGSGKSFMAREGVFDGLDAAITWHPGSTNGVSAGSTLANIQALFRFKGVAAHAAAQPDAGRSALDGVELMNVGVNFLREHMPIENRVHYAITNPGGLSPNVVQSYAEVLYLCRAPKNAGAQELYDWVCDIARGAALMTHTSVEIEFIKACSNIVPNNALEKVLQRVMESVPLPEYTAEELAPVAAIRATNPGVEAECDKLTAEGKEDTAALLAAAGDLCRYLAPYHPSAKADPGSSDVGDVSWICPTAQIGAATLACMTPGHSWQVVSQGKSAVAHKAMLWAGKVMAGAAIELVHSPETLAAAKEELARRTPGGYICPIPKGVMPKAISTKM